MYQVMNFHTGCIIGEFEKFESAIGEAHHWAMREKEIFAVMRGDQIMWDTHNGRSKV